MAWKIVPAPGLTEDARGECLLVEEKTVNLGPAPSHAIVAQVYSREYAERILAGERARRWLPWLQATLLVLFLANLGAVGLFVLLFLLQARVIGASF